MEFILEANIVFEAESIDDAFIILSEHFRSMADGEGGILDPQAGSVEIRRV